MNTQSTSHFSVPSIFRSLTWFKAALMLVMVAIPLLMSTSASTQGVMSSPILARIAIDSQEGVILIHGEGFSPSGMVILIIKDGQGHQLHAPVWVEASGVTQRSHDSATGFVESGTIDANIRLGELESTVVVILAFDVQTETWSLVAGDLTDGQNADGAELTPTAEPAPSCTSIRLCESPF